MKFVVLTILSLTLLISCAGVGIPDSSDPYKKLDYAYQAMSQERYIPARRLISEAIDVFQKNGDKQGLAEAYTTFGNFYKRRFRGDTVHEAPKLQESIKYFKLAIDEYKSVGDVNGIAKCHMGIGSAYMSIDKKQGCEHYDKAIKTYDKNGKQFSINPKYKDFPEMVKAFKDEYCK